MRIDGQFQVTPDGKGRMITMKQPVGPCYAITPWNFPAAMGTRKIGPAHRRRLHDGDEARAADAADDAHAGADLPGGRAFRTAC